MIQRMLGLAATALVIAGATLIYRGPGRALVRGHVGDIAATMLVYALVSLVWRARPSVRAAVTLAFAVAIELGQTVWSARSLAGELLVGNTFDPWDLAAYAAGVVIAYCWDRATTPHDPQKVNSH